MKLKSALCVVLRFPFRNLTHCESFKNWTKLEICAKLVTSFVLGVCIGCYVTFYFKNRGPTDRAFAAYQ